MTVFPADLLAAHLHPTKPPREIASRFRGDPGSLMRFRGDPGLLCARSEVCS
jgi:hypothetical protein